ncbi:hypothetical protein DEO72_LG1g2098 [Vigna unguiculata]|uniref:OTU domain-containing protein n=1 Tax=Vigna unguiculata TaxID=3917 RepID=A0A4D6KPF8_VIGUN|nr:hypothetical protein DEO72_LG1g2098 [Vigna unguiculata]
MSEKLRNGSGSSSSSLNSISLETEDDQTIASILAEDENLKADNRLGKRLSHLDSIPHTPRVNGEIPDVNDATLDHGRLSERLVTYGLAELQMEGDGNCQFRALADQLFRKSDYHKHVRRQVIKQLKHHKKLYEGYVPMEYKSYLKKMKKSGEWGDHVTLQAAADRSSSVIKMGFVYQNKEFHEGKVLMPTLSLEAPVTINPVRAEDHRGSYLGDLSHDEALQPKASALGLASDQGLVSHVVS